MIVVNNKFNINQIVYLKTDMEQFHRIVTGITIRPNDTLVYAISCGSEESTHYEFEISEERDVLITTNG